jgi:hypothetical protein
MGNHTEESLNEARLQGQWDRQDRKAIQDHYADDEELYNAYLNGYDPKGEIVPFEKQWKNRLQTLREKSVAGINFSDALATVITNGEFRTLSDEQQRELIQAWLYPTNTDEENREWYRQRASEFEFQPMLSTCCYCGEREACYNGITSAVNGVIFQFCKICRDELQMIKLQTKASRP